MSRKLIQEKLSYMSLSEDSKFDISVAFDLNGIAVPFLSFGELGKGYTLEQAIGLTLDFFRSYDHPHLLPYIVVSFKHYVEGRGLIVYDMTPAHLALYDSSFKQYANKEYQRDHFIYITDLEPFQNVNTKQSTSSAETRKRNAWGGL